MANPPQKRQSSVFYDVSHTTNTKFYIYDGQTPILMIRSPPIPKPRALPPKIRFNEVLLYHIKP